MPSLRQRIAAHRASRIATGWSSSRSRDRFSRHIYQAAAKPESERTPGEKLLAIQVFEAVNVPGAARIDKVLPPDDARAEDGI